MQRLPRVHAGTGRCPGGAVVRGCRGWHRCISSFSVGADCCGARKPSNGGAETRAPVRLFLAPCPPGRCHGTKRCEVSPGAASSHQCPQTATCPSLPPRAEGRGGDSPHRPAQPNSNTTSAPQANAALPRVFGVAAMACAQSCCFALSPAAIPAHGLSAGGEGGQQLGEAAAGQVGEGREPCHAAPAAVARAPHASVPRG